MKPSLHSVRPQNPSPVTSYLFSHPLTPHGATGAAANNTSITNTAAPQGNVCCKHPKYPLCIFDYLPTLTVLDGTLVELLREAAMDAALSQVKQGDSSASLTEADILAADNWLLGPDNAADSAPAPAPALVLDPSASAANVTSTQKVNIAFVRLVLTIMCNVYLVLFANPAHLSSSPALHGMYILGYLSYAEGRFQPLAEESR